MQSKTPEVRNISNLHHQSQIVIIMENFQHLSIEFLLTGKIDPIRIGEANVVYFEID